MSHVRQQMTEMYHAFIRILCPKLLTRLLIYYILHSECDTCLKTLKKKKLRILLSLAGFHLVVSTVVFAKF